MSLLYAHGVRKGVTLDFNLRVSWRKMIYQKNEDGCCVLEKITYKKLRPYREHSIH